MAEKVPHDSTMFFGGNGSEPDPTPPSNVPAFLLGLGIGLIAAVASLVIALLEAGQCR